MYAQIARVLNIFCGVSSYINSKLLNTIILNCIQITPTSIYAECAPPFIYYQKVVGMLVDQNSGWCPQSNALSNTRLINIPIQPSTL